LFLADSLSRENPPRLRFQNTGRPAQRPSQPPDGGGENTQSAVSEHTGEAIDALRTRYEAVEERLGEVYASAKKNISAGAQHTDEAIRANPYQSMAIAVGVGLLIGVLIGRRSSK
jgi:ElaB/YqjD/DUF883 family membrane-anchored ribosome-binding protein